MIIHTVNKKEKTIKVETDYSFASFEIKKHREYFHFSFIKNKYQSMGCCLFFNTFNGRKYYPKEITVVKVDIEAKAVFLKYN